MYCYVKNPIEPKTFSWGVEFWGGKDTQTLTKLGMCVWHYYGTWPGPLNSYPQGLFDLHTLKLISA